MQFPFLTTPGQATESRTLTRRVRQSATVIPGLLPPGFPLPGPHSDLPWLAHDPLSSVYGSSGSGAWRKCRFPSERGKNKARKVPSWKIQVGRDVKGHTQKT